MNNTIVKLLACIALCFLFAFAGSTFTPAQGSEWYYSVLNKPSWNPPDWLFPPVWSLLFLMMSLSLFLVVKNGLNSRTVKRAVVMFVLQLLLNLAWSASFFGLHAPLLAFMDIILLWVALVVTIMMFKPISKPAAYLLVPYLLWVSFASYLNFVIWQLNR
ncbi:MAG: tryptophan-rich sensory protein [Chlorobiaceae bacterium]|nr:tryptophan-rich sensory protein [Chlorobiaceae bacterium]